MPVTLNDEQLAALKAQWAEAQSNKEIAEFARRLWNDPKTANKAKALAKEMWPELQISDYDLEQKVEQRLAEEREAREKAEKEKLEAEAKQRIDAQRKSVQEQYGFTDDAMARMEEEMRSRHVYDYEAMAPYFASKQPKPIETTGGHFWNHHKQDKFKEIVSDPEDYAFNELARAVTEDDQRRRSMR